MTDDDGLRPLYLLLFAAGIGILTLLAAGTPVFDTVRLAGPTDAHAVTEGVSTQHR